MLLPSPNIKLLLGRHKRDIVISVPSTPSQSPEKKKIHTTSSNPSTRSNMISQAPGGLFSYFKKLETCDELLEHNHQSFIKDAEYQRNLREIKEERIRVKSLKKDEGKHDLAIVRQHRKRAKDWLMKPHPPKWGTSPRVSST